MSIDTRCKIKIAQVITRFDWSGAPDIVEAICSHLSADLYDLKLISGPTRYPAEKTKEFLNKFRDRITVIRSLKREIGLIDDLLAFIRLYFLFRREKFDIVHTHTAKAGFIGRLAARLAGVSAVIHTPHGHNFYGYFDSLGNQLVIILERIAALFNDKIIVFTAIEKRDMIKYRICKSSKIEVIQSGLDLVKFNKININARQKREEFNIEPDSLLVGMVGRLESVKGPEYFVDSIRFIINELPKVKFLIVGDGTLKENLMSRCRNLNISDKVFFTGWREDIPQILSILDILVLSSLNEAVGRIILEAGACGTPAVATAVGGVPEILKDNKTGILVSSRDPEKLAQAIVSLLKDEKKRQQMGCAAKEWVNANFNESKMAQEIHNLYTELIPHPENHTREGMDS